ncbi:hypothetical protein FRB99_001029 [Tulasnella sp. 403]|nr:hypothetical protein FRB99_001029 [Tulasnella sp. 403]
MVGWDSIGDDGDTSANVIAELNAASGQRTGPDEDGEGQVVTVPTARFSTSERTLFTIQSPKRFRQDNIRTRPWSPDWEAPKPPPLVPPDVEPVPPLPTYQPPPSATSSKRSTIIPARMVNRPIIPLPVPRPTDSTYGNPGLPLAPRPARQQMQSSPKLQPEVQSPPPSHLPVSPRAPRATLSAVAGSFNISSPSTAKIPMVPASSILSPTVSEADSDMDPSRRRMRALRAAAPPSAYSTGQKPSQRLSKQP